MPEPRIEKQHPEAEDHSRRLRSRAARPGVVMLLTAAILGGGVTGGVLASTGALDSGSSSNGVVVQEAAASGGPSTSNSSGDVSGLYAGAAPAVVEITAKSSSQGSAQGPFPQSGQSQSATGTGFVVDGDGHILTAAHVVDGASSITVTFQDGTTRTATVLGKDDATDAAVVKVDSSGLDLHPVKLGDSGALQVGDELSAIGSPFGYQESLSTGVVSGLDRTIQAPNGFTVAHAIQTDAALNPGNSGGPVLNAAGDVIGIADQIATGGSTSSDSYTGVGFAVPIDLVKSELSQLENGQSVQHAYLGVSTGTAQSGTAGALVGSVASGSPAANAGLRAGDVITAMDSNQITAGDALVAAIAGHKPGDHVTLTIHRGSQTSSVGVTLGTQPSQASQG
jgi:S1-C subfamily serine protease